ncbi:MAG: arginine--tRNA ligase [Thermofilum sp.]|nr:arginine--tRNA ligase [Thermofilum sp.]
MERVYSAHSLLVSEVSSVAKRVLSECGIEASAELVVERAPPERGDLTVNVYRLARDEKKAVELAAQLSEALARGARLVGAARSEGGFVNIEVNPDTYGRLVWKVVSEMGEKYGFNPHPRPLRILVEHTSANPVHPLHVGHLRNCVVGDALARILRARGHSVEVHFYVDDVGLQMSYAAYGFEKVKGLKRDVKPDHFIGLVYAVTNAVVNIRALQKKREHANPDERARIDRELSDWLWVAKELMERDEELFAAIAEAAKSEDPLERIYAINRAYEAGEKWAVSLVREVAERCIEGFKQTLDRLGVAFDSWDWESEVTVWNGLTAEVLRRLRESGFLREDKGALAFEADRLAEDPEVRRRLAIPASFSVTSLVLVRSDGTTLYATRDIAYSVWKFRRGVDKVINVVGAQQALEQAHVRLALYAMGYVREAENMVHFAYEMVTLPGTKMSGRRGRFVSADELIEEAVRRAGEELAKRGLDPAENREIAEKVGIGAVKFAMLSVSPSRPLTFTWERVLDFERNSGPFVQYAYVRARSVLRKAGSLKPEVAEGAFGSEERKLLFLLGYFPEVVARAADELKVELLPQYLNELALAFNKYYDEVPILKAEPEEKARARLALTLMVAVTLENGMRLLGIEPPSRM